MGSSYHQFCPVAKAMELLDERWTLLVLRELLYDSRRFNDLCRGLPTMSPTLLSKRLQQLVRAGLVTRSGNGQEVEYRLTEAGRELEPVVRAIGAWGVRWIGDLGEVDLDPQLLLWDLHRNVDLRLVPPGRTVVTFRFPDLAAKRRSWWLVLTPEAVDVCDFDPGYEVGGGVTGKLIDLVRIWRGDLSWPQALRSGIVELQGTERVRRAIPAWFPPSAFAAVPRADLATTG
jgi:DNA-binding HxlR family transcriptional regulator